MAVPASVRVESERSLRSREAILDVIDGVCRAKDVPVPRQGYEGITEATLDELAEYVSATVQRPSMALQVGTLHLTCSEFFVDARLTEVGGRWLASADTPDGPSRGMGGTPDALVEALQPMRAPSTSCSRASLRI